MHVPSGRGPLVRNVPPQRIHPLINERALEADRQIPYRRYRRDGIIEILTQERLAK